MAGQRANFIASTQIGQTATIWAEIVSHFELKSYTIISSGMRKEWLAFFKILKVN